MPYNNPPLYLSEQKAKKYSLPQILAHLNWDIGGTKDPEKKKVLQKLIPYVKHNYSHAMSKTKKSKSINANDLKKKVVKGGQLIEAA